MLVGRHVLGSSDFRTNADIGGAGTCTHENIGSLL